MLVYMNVQICHQSRATGCSFITALDSVVLFNYRGYGRSTGVPSPHDNAKDAKELVLHLHRHCRVPRIVMHGESIGGMAAAFSANELPGMGKFLSYLKVVSLSMLSFVF